MFKLALGWVLVIGRILEKCFEDSSDFSSSARSRLAKNSSFPSSINVLSAKFSAIPSLICKPFLIGSIPETSLNGVLGPSSRFESGCKVKVA